VALTQKERAFVEYYLTVWSGAEAARLAGYSAKTAKEQASRLLTKVNIKAAIEERLAELKMSADEVLTRLTEHARASLGDFIDVSPPSTDIEGAADVVEAHQVVGGWRLNLVKAEQRGKLHLVKKIKSGQWGPEIELHDAQAALALLGRHHKLFIDRTEHTGADGAPLAIQFNQALDAAYADDPDTDTTSE
jgi:phage terminase small subunit